MCDPASCSHVRHAQQAPKRPAPYLGGDFFDTRIDPERRKRNHIRQLQALGYKVTLEPAA